MTSWSYETEVMPREQLAHYICSAAGSIMLDLFHKKIKHSQKAVHDFVTVLDTEIEALAIKSIKQSFPEDSVFCEESEGIQRSGDWVWVVDPIDGTNNYVRGLPFAGVQIALLFKGEIIFGLISRPFTQDMYWAIKSQGAYYQNSLTGEKRRIHVSDRLLTTSIGVFDARVGKVDNPSTPLFHLLIDRINMARVFGVAVYDIPAVAEGSVDFLVTGVAKKYDVAPGWLLVEEAGGSVYGLTSNAAIDDTLLIFSNQTCKEQLVEVIT